MIRPPASDGGALEAAARALREAARRMSPYVLVPADPLAAVATAWQAMWQAAQGPAGAAEFERQAAAVLAAWQAGRFELPDYYLVLAPAGDAPSPPAGSGQPAGPGQPPGTGFHLGPLRAARPRRVTAVIAAGGPEQAAGIRQALRALPHGPWWPPLTDVIDGARGFFAGSLAEAPAASPGLAGG